MNLRQIAIALFAGAALTASLSPALAQMSSDPGLGGRSSSQDTTVTRFGRSGAGSDPATELPFAATAGRPPYAQGDAQ